MILEGIIDYYYITYTILYRLDIIICVFVMEGVRGRG